MAEAVEARSSTTTMVIDSKNGDIRSSTVRGSRKTFTDDIYLTFSSPMAWILVLALVITWSCVFIIMFDLTDYKTISGKERLTLPNVSEHIRPPEGRSPPAVRKVLKESGHRGLSKVASDPMKLVNDVVEESANLVGLVLKFAANLIAPDEDEGTVTLQTN
uniref:Triadin n=1 Tax=Mola mola TaxID=94237 RepID=A0A3Q4BKU8_MOLML